MRGPKFVVVSITKGLKREVGSPDGTRGRTYKMNCRVSIRGYTIEMNLGFRLNLNYRDFTLRTK